MSTRFIYRSHQGSATALRDLLQVLFVAELIAPSEQLLVQSPYISEFPVFDNRNGQFSYLELEWGAHFITFSSVLGVLLRRGTEVKIRCTVGPNADPFVEKLNRRTEFDGTSQFLDILQQPKLGPKQGLSHAKGLIADTWALTGSMNLTYNGVNINGEHLDFFTGSTDVAQKRVLFSTEFETES